LIKDEVIDLLRPGAGCADEEQGYRPAHARRAGFTSSLLERVDLARPGASVLDEVAG